MVWIELNLLYRNMKCMDWVNRIISNRYSLIVFFFSDMLILEMARNTMADYLEAVYLFYIRKDIVLSVYSVESHSWPSKADWEDSCQREASEDTENKSSEEDAEQIVHNAEIDAVYVEYAVATVAVVVLDVNRIDEGIVHLLPKNVTIVQSITLTSTLSFLHLKWAVERWEQRLCAVTLIRFFWCLVSFMQTTIFSGSQAVSYFIKINIIQRCV